ncbi:hypothetical protein GUJ93_ZPchr0012g20536 [Zizania palustris]|uniref:Uncharacterized protein n=1 Tax=Zizania palustris TaxID=103762 RepID=A0A8J5WWY2_ZIZPA|nr:hypothetical protein GUJ93_ZPchr0009g674 [Zizania palustris]KAG8094878.1 hypothetical protein GUJ93_ZPchr0012g20536 [Zizania palustris]
MASPRRLDLVWMLGESAEENLKDPKELLPLSRFEGFYPQKTVGRSWKVTPLGVNSTSMDKMEEFKKQMKLLSKDNLLITEASINRSIEGFISLVYLSVSVFPGPTMSTTVIIPLVLSVLAGANFLLAIIWRSLISSVKTRSNRTYKILRFPYKIAWP